MFYRDKTENKTQRLLSNKVCLQLWPAWSAKSSTSWHRGLQNWTNSTWHWILPLSLSMPRQQVSEPHCTNANLDDLNRARASPGMEVTCWTKGRVAVPKRMSFRKSSKVRPSVLWTQFPLKCPSISVLYFKGCLIVSLILWDEFTKVNNKNEIQVIFWSRISTWPSFRCFHIEHLLPSIPCCPLPYNV